MGDAQVDPGVRVEHEDGFAVLTIDRPSSRNAIGLGTIGPLRYAIQSVAASAARVLAVRGGGDRVFISGGDLKELAALRTTEQAQAMARDMRRTLDALSELEIPVVGVLNGDAYGGGCEFAMACDFRIAVDGIRLAFNQVALDIMPAWGGIERLVAAVGRPRAMYLLSTGRVLTAAEAQACGLVEEVVPRSEFEQRWRDLLVSLARSSPLSLRGIKAVIGAADGPARPELEESSTAVFATTWTSDAHWDAVERLQAQRRAARSG
jgi:enoyl-CoA hydratase/carnithine racemase